MTYYLKTPEQAAQRLLAAKTGKSTMNVWNVQEKLVGNERPEKCQRREQGFAVRSAPLIQWLPAPWLGILLQVLRLSIAVKGDSHREAVTEQ